MTPGEIRSVLDASLTCRPRCSDPRFKETEWECVMAPRPEIILHSETVYITWSNPLDPNSFSVSDRPPERVAASHHGGLAIDIKDFAYPWKEQADARQIAWAKRREMGYPVYRATDIVLEPFDSISDYFKPVYEPL